MKVKRPLPASNKSQSQSSASADDVKLNLVEESATITKQDVVTGRLRVSTHVETFEHIAKYDLHSETVEITRVPIDRTVEGPLPQIRIEGDLTIIPVFEETVVVEKKLVLIEEIHIRRRSATESLSTPVTLRRQRAEVDRSK